MNANRTAAMLLLLCLVFGGGFFLSSLSNDATNDIAGQAIGRQEATSGNTSQEAPPDQPTGTPAEQFYAVTGFYPDEFQDFAECTRESANANEFSDCIGTETAGDDDDGGMTPQEIIDFLSCFYRCTMNGGSGNRDDKPKNPCTTAPDSLECCIHTSKAICDCACECQSEFEWDDCYDGWLFWDGCTQKLEPYCKAWVKMNAR